MLKFFSNAPLNDRVAYFHILQKKTFLSYWAPKNFLFVVTKASILVFVFLCSFGTTFAKKNLQYHCPTNQPWWLSGLEHVSNSSRHSPEGLQFESRLRHEQI